jgi:hypothetical protein
MVKREHKLIQSYVRDKFFISTIYRQCSAPAAPDIWYYETIIWEWDAKTKERGKMLEQQDSGSFSGKAFLNHIDLCEKYNKPSERSPKT